GIVFVGRPNEGEPIGTHADLQVYHFMTNQAENRTPSMEMGILGRLSGRTATAGLANPYIAISPDGTQAYVQVQKAGTVNIYRVALLGDENWDVVIGGDRDCVLLDMRAETLLFAADDILNPEDLYCANLDGSDERQLTHLNA